MVVMDVMIGCPASGQATMKMGVMNDEVTQPVGDVAEGYGTSQQKGVAGWYHQDKYPQQAQQQQCRQKKRYSIVAQRILVMCAVTIHHQSQRSVEYPAVKEILEKTEKKQTDQNGEKCRSGMNIPAHQTGKDLGNPNRNIEKKFAPVVFRSP